MLINVCDFISGCVSGASGILIGHPADTIKVRQQTDRNSVVTIILNIWKHEGLRGYYKGCFFPVMSNGVTNALYFGFYANSLRLITANDKKRLCCDSESVDQWHLKMILAGGIGGMASLLTSCPVELVKIRLQVDKHKDSIGSKRMVKYLYEKQGIRVFYKGWVIMAMRDIPSFAAYAAVYEHSVCVLESHKVTGHPKLRNEMIAGGIAGLVSWIPIMPVDVVKSRIQSDNLDHPKYKNIRDCFVKTYQKEGLLFFYKGSIITALRAFPVNAITFSVYSNMNKLCEREINMYKSK
ncbi:solute carrier family 25 member 45-like [Cimex lectularius]|uniref:Mitochondrial carrier protein n=1 Tax=Cimex lectularius TaxID=79782 RepID=A0A8I6RJV7_CIMLE|nr:solute carrier family 25 member 45-like [Cimex lectularius]